MQHYCVSVGGRPHCHAAACVLAAGIEVLFKVWQAWRVWCGAWVAEGGWPGVHMASPYCPFTLPCLHHPPHPRPVRPQQSNTQWRVMRGFCYEACAAQSIWEQGGWYYAAAPLATCLGKQGCSLLAPGQVGLRGSCVCVLPMWLLWCCSVHGVHRGLLCRWSQQEVALWLVVGS